VTVTKLLLVEDHDELSDFLSRRLRRRGFDVVLARDGPDALQQAESEAPDLMLLDMNLPLIDGWTVARMLRQNNNTVPIIALTAHAMSGDRTKALEAGCDEHHAKPVDFDLLLSQIDEALLRRESQDGV
jgi:two-component system, cell cycle response regulator DivK